MSIIATTKKTLLVGTHPKGIPFIVGFLALTIIGYLIYSPIGCLFLTLTIFSIYFFRNPSRMIPQGAGMVLASGDGMVCGIDANVSLPKELNMHENDGSYTRISIFLSVFNVHVNRVPVSGEVLNEIYIAGKFFNAALDKSSDENERSIIAVQNGEEVFGFVQIAGFVARRIVCQLYKGDVVKQGDRYGIIRFGSRCDIYVPNYYKVMVAVDSVAIGGETIIAVNPSTYNPSEITWQKS